MPTAYSTPNIALIKYWGNRSNPFRLPAADSLSMTLDSPGIRVRVELSDRFRIQSFDTGGREKLQSMKSIGRLRLHFDLTKHYLETLGRERDLPKNVSIRIDSSIPPAIGIASSAALFSALAEAYAAFVKGTPLSRQELSIIARLGSGSAARSVFGGFVTLENIPGDGIDSTVSRQIAPPNHWILHDVIIVPSQEEKKVGSTEGHAMAHTSPLFEARVKTIPRRMRECIEAIEKKDFEKLQCVSEEDALDMHRVMETQNPPLKYLSEETHRIIQEIESLQKKEKLEVLYTLDAGPTVHLLCTEPSLKAVQEFAESQKNCTLFKAKIGRGSYIQ